MALCESCIRNKDCKWNKGNPRHCTLYTDKKETNFDRITESPEALAEFIGSVLDCCTDEFGECKHCPLNENCSANKYFKQIALEWLKQESDAE